MFRRAALIAFAAGVGSPAWAGTCSLCRETLRMGASTELIKGYYWSIVILVAIPLVILATGLRFAWRRYK